MSFRVALFTKTPEGAIQLLGRTDEPAVVSFVRDHFIKTSRQSLHDIERHPSNDPHSSSNTDAGGTS